MVKFGEKISCQEASNMNAVTLAFIGDAVFSLYVREYYVLRKDYKCGKLNGVTSAVVSATNQSKEINGLLDELTETELAVFKRCRNAKKNSRAKNASIIDYNNSTGFEGLVGYLYLTGQLDRLEILINKMDFVK